MPELAGYEAVTPPEYDGSVSWQVFASASDRAGQLMTFVHIESGNDSATSGFGGPGLYADSRVNFWYGRTRRLPFFVVARFDPSLTSLTIETTRRTLTIPVEGIRVHFGLKFAARPLREDEELVSVYGDPNEKRTEVHPLTFGDIPPDGSAGWRQSGPGNAPTS